MFFFPRLSKAEIEREVAKVLAGYENKHGEVLSLVTPIEEIVENYLGYTLEMRPVEDEDVLGWINCAEKSIVINQILDPHEDTRSSTLARYRFTTGHEGGHAVLHSASVLMRAEMPSLFGKDNAPQILCRSRDERRNVEWQANFFSAAILMPKPKVSIIWQETTGSDHPFWIKDDDIEAATYESVVFDLRGRKQIHIKRLLNPFVQGFKVSHQAAFIRLKELGWLIKGHRNMVLV